MKANNSMAGLLMALVLAGCGWESSTYREADHLIRVGHADTALRMLQEARVDAPWNEALLFEIGGAQFAAAAQGQWTDGAPDGEQGYRDAHETFQRLRDEGSPERHADAAFNAATVLLGLDSMLVAPGRYEARIENLREARAHFTALLDDAPDRTDIRQNLDHVCYTLATLLQSPPEENDTDDQAPEDEPPAPTSAVDSVATQIPNAQAEIVDGSTIVLHLPPRSGAKP